MNNNFKKFKLGNLFEFEAIKQAKSQREIPDDNTIAGIPYIVQSMFNNMFSRNVNKQWLIDHNEAPVSGNKIVLGVTLPAVSYQPREFGASQVITAEAVWLNKEIGMYMVTVISKMMYQFSYSKKPGLQIYKDMEVELPINNTGKIDFGYMEARIRELEEARIRELDAYLKVTGLYDYVLSEEDQKLLTHYREREREVKTRAFKLGELFDFSVRGKRIKYVDRKPGDLPFITAGVGEMGFSSYISNEQTTIFPKDSLTIDMFGSAFYRGYEYGADDHITVLYNTKKNYSRHVLQFIQAGINKATQGLFTYSRNFYPKDALPIEVYLPIDNNGELDVEFMEQFIKIQQKLAIKNVIEWRYREIKTTRQIVVF